MDREYYSSGFIHEDSYIFSYSHVFKAITWSRFWRKTRNHIEMSKSQLLFTIDFTLENLCCTNFVQLYLMVS